MRWRVYDSWNVVNDSIPSVITLGFMPALAYASSIRKILDYEI